MDEAKKDTSVNYTITKMISCLIILLIIFLIRYYNTDAYNFISTWYKSIILHESININTLKDNIYYLFSSFSEFLKTCTFDILRSVTS